MADYECNEDKLKILVGTYGAAVTSLYASDPGFRNYGGGVLATCAKDPANHAVLGSILQSFISAEYVSDNFHPKILG
jgi:hypothetical protein